MIFNQSFDDRTIYRRTLEYVLWWIKWWIKWLRIFILYNRTMYSAKSQFNDFNTNFSISSRLVDELNCAIVGDGVCVLLKRLLVWSNLFGSQFVVRQFDQVDQFGFQPFFCCIEPSLTIKFPVCNFGSLFQGQRRCVCSTSEYHLFASILIAHLSERFWNQLSNWWMMLELPNRTSSIFQHFVKMKFAISHKGWNR